MQYNFINIGAIEGDDKLSIARTLKDCEDIKLFELESIQMILDFKWKTYTQWFFMVKFVLYLTFVVSYLYDIEEALDNSKVQEVEKEGNNSINLFNIRITKFITMIVMMIFFLYELV